MINEYIDVKGYWGVLLCHELHRLDEYEMRSIMMSLGVRGAKLDEATDILLFNENTGMCISNDRLKMSVVFIGAATSEEQHWDTVVHELYHAACAICEYYDVPQGGEDFAWTIGYLTRKAVQLIGEPCVDR